MKKLGLIAGGGQLPVRIAEFCTNAGRPFFVVRLKGFADEDMKRFEGKDVGLAEFGHAVAALKGAGCEAVCFAGKVDRPDFAKLVPDLKGMTLLPGAVAAARQGDDALLRFLLEQFEKEGFSGEGTDEVIADLTLQPGALGAHKPDARGHADLYKAMYVARASGQLDIGQGAVVADGLVLAVEAAEGTDAMLERVAALPEALRGSAEARRGVLAKVPKPIQDRRLDLPAMGVRTVERAAAAGLAGIVGEAGGLIVIDREAVIEAADRLGLFVWGADSSAPRPE